MPGLIVESRHDARGIANAILDQADLAQLPITNMAINKIIYFAHAWFLIRLTRPLVIQSFEAWQHGPLIQDVYHSFKKFGDKPILGRATRLDRHTAQYTMCESRLDGDELTLLSHAVKRYAPISAAELRRMTHVVGGPWHKVWNYEGASNPGMVIPDEAIGEFYRERSLSGEVDAYSQGTQSSAFRALRQ